MRRPGLSTLVLDEADLMLSMPGYEEDLQAIAPLVRPSRCRHSIMGNDGILQAHTVPDVALEQPLQGLLPLDLAHLADP